MLKKDEIQSYLHEIKRRKECGEKIGPVYAIDIAGIPPEFLYLMKSHFNLRMWGKDDLAMNRSIQPDEYEIIGLFDIKKGDRVYEPACGSGRTLAYLAKLSDNVVGTDVEEKVVEYAKTKLIGTKAKVLVDDIRCSDIPRDYFHYIFSFENLIGYFVTESERYIALMNHVSRLREEGILALSYRTVNDRSLDQYDPAPEDQSAFGLWHSFSHREMYELATHCCQECTAEIVSVIQTPHSRPIGGTMSYIIIKKS